MTAHLQQITVHYSFPVVFTRHLFSPRNLALRKALTRDAPRAPPVASSCSTAASSKPSPTCRATSAPTSPPTPNISTSPVPPHPLRRRSHQANHAPHPTHPRRAPPRQHLPPLLLHRHRRRRILDAAGFAAALFHRGVRRIRIPTTALAQCDSGVGVKNAINYKNAKNLLGAFAPWAVLNDAAFLDNLPQPLLLDGIAEAVKVAAIKDARFFRAIERAARKSAAATCPSSGAP